MIQLAESKYEREQLEVSKRILAVVECLLEVAISIDCNLKQVLAILRPEPDGFSITQTGDSMPLTPIAPGFSPVFTATPLPAGTAPGPGLVPVMTSSDTVNAPVTTDPSGLIGTVAIPASAVVGTAFTLTETLTNADGTVATGSASFTIVAPPSPDVTSFSIAQTA